jgi:hypothetical protein
VKHRTATREWAQKVYAARKASGLTIRGTVPKYAKHPELRGLPLKMQRRLRYEQYRDAWRAQGLTAQGKPRSARYRHYPELKGLPPAERTRRRNQIWHQGRVMRRARMAVASLLAGGSNAALVVQLKGTR